MSYTVESVDVMLNFHECGHYKLELKILFTNGKKESIRSGRCFDTEKEAGDAGELVAKFLLSLDAKGLQDQIKEMNNNHPNETNERLH